MATTGRKQVGPGQTISSVWGNQVWDQSIQCFNSDADRLTQYPNPHPGAVWYLADTGILQMWNGTAVVVVPTGLSQRLTNAAVAYTGFSTWSPMSGLDTGLAGVTIPANAAGSGVRITVPGRYVAQATAAFSVPSIPRGVGVRRNSGTIYQTTDSGAAATPGQMSSPSELFDCIAGDIIEGVVYQQNTGTNAWAAGYLTFRCYRVG